MRKIAASVFFAVALLAPSVALAYVGPGAGLSLLGALWALIAAVGTALIFIVAWPVRRMLRRRRGEHKPDTDAPAADRGPDKTSR